MARTWEFCWAGIKPSKFKTSVADVIMSHMWRHWCSRLFFIQDYTTFNKISNYRIRAGLLNCLSSSNTALGQVYRRKIFSLIFVDFNKKTEWDMRRNILLSCMFANQHSNIHAFLLLQLQNSCFFNGYPLFCHQRTTHNIITMRFPWVVPRVTFYYIWLILLSNYIA